MPDDGRIPGPIVIPNAVQLRLLFTLPNTKVARCVFHASAAGGFSATSTVAEAIFAALKAAAGWTNWRTQLSSGVTFSGVELRDLRTPNQPIVTSTGAAAAGTGAGTALPPGDALTVTLRTAGAGRGFRGRVYLPGLDSSALAAGGVASATTVTNSAAFVTALQTAMASSGLTMAIAQPARQAYTGVTGVNYAARNAGLATVTSIVTRNNIIDHQRRRSGRS